MYFLFIDEYTIEPYTNESLKRYIGNRLVKIIINPTEDELREFGYMTLTADVEPQYNIETEYLVPKYRIENGNIVQGFEIRQKEEN